ncbi:MAG: phosphatase [Lachnospiraceae bacterium]
MKFVIDLHTHTMASGHGYSTFTENITQACENGLEVYGLSEHAPGMPGGPHIFFFHNMKVLPKVLKGMRILRGCEANIMDLDGTLDMEPRSLKKLDYVIASMHVVCVESGTACENTDALIKVMDNPYVTIIGHPDDTRYPLDYERLVLASKEKGVLLEVNNSSLNPHSSRVGGVENVTKMLAFCKRYEVPVILGTDSHYHTQIGDFHDTKLLLDQLDFPMELVVNTSLEKLRKYIKI